MLTRAKTLLDFLVALRAVPPFYAGLALAAPIGGFALTFAGADAPIFLIGLRGAGKTTVARILGLRLGWDWVDADVEVELRAGKSIKAIQEATQKHRFPSFGFLVRLLAEREANRGRKFDRWFPKRLRCT